MTVIPELINGKVVSLKVVGTRIVYDYHSVGQYCSLFGTMSGPFNPEKYDLLQTERYECIADAYNHKKLTFTEKVNEAYRKYPHLNAKLTKEIKINQSFIDIIEHWL